MSAKNIPDPASPYSTGGGGQVLEHLYGAILLTSLLTGDPVPPLGDDVVPQSIRFQASDVSVVDDILLEGVTASGARRTVAIAVRRNPALTTSDEKSVPLIRSFIQAVNERWSEVESGQFRVALAVASPNSAVKQLAELAVIAKSVRSAAEFQTALARPKAINDKVRDRLNHIDALIKKAKVDTALAHDEARVLTWRWLVGLYIQELRLEGVDSSDRTQAIAALRDELDGESVEAANQAFGALLEQAGRWIPASALVDQFSIRRALHGFPLRRSKTFTQAWALLDALALRFRRQSRLELCAGQARLELARTHARHQLVAQLEAVGSRAEMLIVTGDPDTGKSSLTLRAAEDLENSGATILFLSLRDLPQLVIDLEAHLGARLTEVMATGEIQTVRLLILDGVEAVLEGQAAVFEAFAEAALLAGVGVVSIARRDALPRLRDLSSAIANRLDLRDPAEYVVKPLSEEERLELVGAFPALRPQESDERSAWLLGRLGLVDVLLRAGVTIDSGSILSEADVFEAVWNGLIRKNEETSLTGVSADDREGGLIWVALRHLGTSLHLPSPPGQVLRQLRSDGLLIQQASPALSRREEFGSDLLRDFTICRLLLSRGWTALTDAGAPRWTVRAARLACQALLTDSSSRLVVWQELRAAFHSLSAAGGERWDEVPVEALLVLRDLALVTELWDVLNADGQQDLKTFLRLAEQRYVTALEIGDVETLSPIVALAFNEDRLPVEIGRPQRESVAAAVQRIVLAWLRGQIAAKAAPNALRQRVRDKILTSHPNPYDKFAVELVGTLGADIDSAAEAFLRALAADDPYYLGPAVESFAAVIGLSNHNPDLMIHLTEEFYIERPDPEEFGAYSELDDGIRDHQLEKGLGDPFAAWYYGPFHRLLHFRPVETLGVINRMLDHAAQIRVRPSRYPWDAEMAAERRFTGYTFDLPDVGEREYVGDGHVWQWYRGSSVGPYACMSALLATERFADQLISEYGLTPAQVVSLLLRDCHNLAMAGLVVGLLVRYLGSSGDLLDAWLKHPVIWHLEFARVTHEGLVHVQGRDPDDVVGKDRRRHTLGDAAAELMVRAIRTGDESRFAALRDVADALVANSNPSDNDDERQIVEGWASILRRENYIVDCLASGEVRVAYRRPDAVEDALIKHMAQMRPINEATRLEMAYALRNDRTLPTASNTITADLKLARELAANPPERLFMEDSVIAVASAVLYHHALGWVAFEESDINWCAQEAISCAVSLRSARAGTVYPMGADRSAARVLPLILLSPFSHLEVAAGDIDRALAACASSASDEVRLAFASGAKRVWQSPCDVGDSGQCTIHSRLWTAMLFGLEDCRLGPWDNETQSRPTFRLEPPYPEALSTMSIEDLVLNRLAMPISCAASAQSADCLTREVDELLPVLLDADRRCSVRWAADGYLEHGDRGRKVVARVLIELALAGDLEPMRMHLAYFANSARALEQLLTDFQYEFSYDGALLQSFSEFWPEVMRAILDAVEGGATFLRDDHWVDYALAELLPTPKIEPSDPNPDATLSALRTTWLAPAAISHLVDRWISIATGEPRAADSVAQFAQTCAIDWQVSNGLDWLDRVVADRYDLFANKVWWVTSWLEKLRTHVGSSINNRLTRIVDGLAAAGDNRAAAIQRIDE